MHYIYCSTAETIVKHLHERETEIDMAS